MRRRRACSVPGRVVFHPLICSEGLHLTLPITLAWDHLLLTLGHNSPSHRLAAFAPLIYRLSSIK